MAQKLQIKIGLIGGTGLEKNDILKGTKLVQIEPTPYGNASDSQILSGTINGIEVFVLKRHGKEHNINPSNVNYRANLWTLKQLGVTHLLTTTACGSLKLAIEPGHLGIVDQYVDRTTKRETSFYSVAHIPQGRPFNKEIQKILKESCDELGFKCHPNITAVTIEGPRFSTLAESKLYQSWGCDIVNMTTVPEAPLSGELGFIYGSIALVTDYDCWHDNDEESVSVELVEKRMKILGEKVSQVLVLAIDKISKMDWTNVHEKKCLESKGSIMCL